MITKEALKQLTANNQQEIKKLKELGIGVYYKHVSSVTVCFLYDIYDGVVQAYGTAIKNPNDTQNHKYGRFLACHRALKAIQYPLTYGNVTNSRGYVTSRNKPKRTPKLTFLVKKQIA